jgi:hypothetical protein
MINDYKLILDTHCEVYEQLKPWMDELFWDFSKHLTDGKLVPGAVYVIGREQFTLNSKKIIELVLENTIKVIFSNPSEGSETQYQHCRRAGILDLVQQKKILILTGGSVPENYAAMQYETFLSKILDYTENLEEIQKYQEQYKTLRPYKFLFLNGRARDHRKNLIASLETELKNAIWSNLDIGNGPLKLLDDCYEIDNANKNITINNQQFVKNQLFEKNVWGEIYLKAKPYNDTYFSLVGETVFTYPYSFRTEKIWKPVAIGHPWIAASNYGFYRDMHKLGFQTFGHVVDESFDLIDDNRDRLNRIIAVVKDLCQQDLAKFLKECYNVCKYNQQHLEEMRVKVKKEFPERFFNFIKENRLI